MINKIHIFTFALIVVLYLMIGIWKYLPAFIEKEGIPLNDRSEDREEILQFWEAYNQATAFRSQRNYEEAATYYSKALEINENHEDALYYLASMHLLQKNFESAENYLLKLEEQQPNAPRTQLQLGTLHFCMDPDNPLFNPEKSLARYTGAWNLNREETGTPLMLSKIYLFQNEFDEAKSLLNVVTSSNKMSYEALFLDGYVYWLRGDEREARENLQLAMNLYQSLAYAEIHGEGATESGARAMLSEDRYCDGFEIYIQSLLSGRTHITGLTAYDMFNEQLSLWQSVYQ